MLQRGQQPDPATIAQRGIFTQEDYRTMVDASALVDAKMREAQAAKLAVEAARSTLEGTIVGKIALLSGVPNARGNTVDEQTLNPGHISERVFVTKIGTTELTEDGEHSGTRIFIEGYNEQFVRVFGFLSYALTESELGLTIEALEEPVGEQA